MADQKKNDFTLVQKIGIGLLLVASFAAEEYSGFGFGFLKMSYQAWLVAAVAASAIGGAMLARWWGLITGAACGAAGFKAVAWYLQGKQRVHSSEILFVYFASIGPVIVLAFLVWWAVNKLTSGRSKTDSAAAARP